MNSLRLSLTVLLALIVQLTLVDHIAIFSVRPDLTVLIVVLLGLRGGSLTGTLGGFLLGLLQDLLTPATLGMNMLAKSILGYLSGRLGSSLVLPIPLYAPLFLAAVLFHDAIYLLAYTRLDPARFFRVFFVQSVPTALYTAAVGVILLFLGVVLGGGGLGIRREVGGGR
jgi:rod shape-determining protein MreD